MSVSAKTVAVAHIRRVAGRTRSGIPGSTFNVQTSEPLAIMVTNHGIVKMRGKGIWEKIYPKQVDVPLQDLRWEEIGILLGKCEDLGSPLQ